MKLKADFVTNSSSTCYIVVIPSEMAPKKLLENQLEGGEFLDEYGDEIDPRSMYNHIQSLKSGGTMHIEDMTEEEYQICFDAIEKAGLILTSYDNNGGGGEDTITGLPESQIIDFLGRMKDAKG